MLINSHEQYLKKALNGYHFIRMLGSGAQGAVALIQVCTSEQLYCLKLCQCKTQHQSKYLSREIQLAAMLKHANLVNYISFSRDEVNMMVAIKMEYADQGSLTRLVSRQLPQKELLIIFTQILLGLQFLHQSHIIHRDIKPDNILMHSLCDQRLIKLADFGMSRRVEPGAGGKLTICGTPLYMSPEILNGLPYNHKTDIYSLGIVLYELMEGKCPYSAPSIEALKQAQQIGNIRFHTSNRYTQEIMDICRGMLAVDPVSRPDVTQLLQCGCIRAQFGPLEELYRKLPDSRTKDNVMVQFKKVASANVGAASVADSTASVIEDANSLSRERGKTGDKPVESLK